MDDVVRSLSSGVTVFLLSSNASSHHHDTGSLCANLPDQHIRNSCQLAGREASLLDSVAGVRMIGSLLGLIGACSIILSAIIKRRVSNAEVHPIFTLSLADCFLSILWIVGSSFWFSGVRRENRDICYILTLLTGILECVTINLCLLYAIFAYQAIRRTSVSLLLINQGPHGGSSSRRFVVVAYLISWLLPVAIVLSVFFVSDHYLDFLSSTEDCSCWCRPTVVNILPSSHIEDDRDSKKFMTRQLHFMMALSATISIQYVVIFVALVALYLCILCRIRKLKNEIGERNDLLNYGATAMINKGHSQARKRVLIFLTAFVVTGFFNLCSEIFLLPFINLVLNKNSQHIPNYQVLIYYSLLFAQSFTLPLQGFVNAIVYGWSRKDFMNIMGPSRPILTEDDNIYQDDPDGDRRSFSATVDSRTSYDENTENRSLFQ